MATSLDHVRSAILSPNSVLLHGSGWGNEHGLIFTDPETVVTPTSRDELKAVLCDVDNAVRMGYHVAGYLEYEAGAALMGMHDNESSGPLAWFGIYPDEPQVVAADLMDELGQVAVTGNDFNPDRAAYSAAFATVKHHIREGDVYQINLTGRGRFRFVGGAVDLYHRLRLRQPSTYGAIVNTGHRLVMSFSPELFFERYGDYIRTRPMKGTAPRYEDSTLDSEARRFLETDSKNRSENLMIVDLLRNDLSIICRPGSVRTSRMFTVEPLPTVWQMTTDVGGELNPGAGFADIISALFPSGSITGAPKRRAMEVIRNIEPEPRGVYCGAIGYMAPEDRAVFNVAIRTIETNDQRATIGAGGGIVWDSDEAAEFEEMHLKTRFVSGVDPAMLGADFHLIETMSAVHGKIQLLELHLARLHRSARHFGLEVADARQRIEDVLERTGERSIIRLTLDRSSSISLDILPPRAWPDGPIHVGIAPQRLRSTDPLLYHKTSARNEFDAAYAWAQVNGMAEAILLNEKGQVADGTRSSIFLRRGDRWLTPKLSCGVLPGVYRARLLSKEQVEEAVLWPADLAAADEVVMANAVRGSTIVHLVDPVEET